MQILVLIATLALFLSAGAGWSADDSLRIRRPTSAAEVSKDQDADKTSASIASFSTTGGAIPICSSAGEDKSRANNYTCCDITSKYFPLKIAGPSQHFGLWLKLNLYPTLCHSVLCQRQCALNGYESCNALGVERNLIQQLIDNDGDCSGGGRTGSSASCCDGNESNMSSNTK